MALGRPLTIVTHRHSVIAVCRGSEVERRADLSYVKRGPIRKNAGVPTPELIRRRRNVLGLTQAELARRVGIDERTMRRIEAGETQLSLLTAVELAKALDVSIDELAKGE